MTTQPYPNLLTLASLEVVPRLYPDPHAEKTVSFTLSGYSQQILLNHISKMMH
jgi:hypothetical protein